MAVTYFTLVHLENVNKAICLTKMRFYSARRAVVAHLVDHLTNDYKIMGSNPVATRQQEGMAEKKIYEISKVD
jgi:hypothetical protein